MNPRQTKARSRVRSRVGHSLLELVVTMGTASFIMAGLASSLYIAGQSLDPSGTAKRAEADKILDTFVADVEHALSFSERTANAVTFTVPSRDGDNVPDTIRYAWSGTPGDPLTYEYNGSAAEKIAEDVQDFNLASTTRTMLASVIPPSAGGANLLFVSGQYADGDGGLGTPTAEEQVCINLLEGWGYTTTIISDQDSQSVYDTALAETDVVYVSGKVNGSTLGNKLNAATMGVVTESYLHSKELGIYETLSPQYMPSTTIFVDNTSHYITNQFSNGSLTVLTSSYDMKWTSDNPVSSTTTLASIELGATPYKSLITADQGDTLAGGATAAGRRVQLPWGESGFSAASLNSDGQTTLQRTIEWAAGAGDDSTGLVGHWMLDETSGTTAADSSGYGNHGTVHGTVAWTSGVQENGHDFHYLDGEDYIEIPNSTSLEDVQEGDYTVAAWFKPGSIPPGVDPANDGDYGIVIKQGWSTGLVYKYDGTFFFSHWLEGTTGVFPSSGGTTYDIDTFYHVAGVVDREAGTAKLYVDGSLISTESFTPGTAGLDLGTNLWRCGIASPGASQWGWAADGVVDDVQIYSRALGDSDIAAIAAGGSGSGGSVTIGNFTEATASSNVTSLNVATPSGTSAGDLLVMAVATDGDTKSSLVAAGWNEIVVEERFSEVTFGVWWKLAGSSEPSSHSVTWTGNQEAYGWMIQFTGHDPTNPINDWSLETTGSGVTLTPTSPEVTTTVDNALILRLAGFDDDDITIGDPGLSGHTAITMDKSDTGSHSTSGGAGYVVQPTAGASGTSTFTLTDEEQTVAVTIAIAPEP